MLPLEHFTLFVRLVRASHLVSKESLSPAELKQADADLQWFTQEYHRLYTTRNCSYNLHQLRHFARAVEDWGPAGNFWTFNYESAIGDKIGRVKGTQLSGREIVRSAALQQCTSALAASLKTPRIGTDYALMLERLRNPQSRRTAVVVTEHGDRRVSVVLTRNIYDSTAFRKSDPALYCIVSKLLAGIPFTKLSVSRRCALPGGFTVVAKDNAADKDYKRNASLVLIHKERIFECALFICVSVAQGSQKVAVGKFLETNPCEYFGCTKEFPFFLRGVIVGEYVLVNTRKFVKTVVEVTWDSKMERVFVVTPNCLNADL